MPEGVMHVLDHNHDLDWSAKDPHLSREPSEMDLATYLYGGDRDEGEGPVKPKATVTTTTAATTTATKQSTNTTTPIKSTTVQPTPAASSSATSDNTPTKPTSAPSPSFPQESEISHKNGASSTSVIPDRAKFAVKDIIEANYQEDGAYFPGRISRVNDDGTYDIGIHPLLPLIYSLVFVPLDSVASHGLEPSIHPYALMYPMPITVSIHEYTSLILPISSLYMHHNKEYDDGDVEDGVKESMIRFAESVDVPAGNGTNSSGTGAVAVTSAPVPSTHVAQQHNHDDDDDDAQYEDDYAEDEDEEEVVTTTATATVAKSAVVETKVVANNNNNNNVTTTTTAASPTKYHSSGNNNNNSSSNKNNKSSINNNSNRDEEDDDDEPMDAPIVAKQSSPLTPR